MASSGLKRAIAVLAIGGATVALGGAAAGIVLAEGEQGATQGTARQDRQQQFLASLAAKLGVTQDQLKQAFDQTRQELGMQQGPGHPGGPGGHERGGPGGPGGGPGRGGPAGGLDPAAKAIGVSPDQLRQELVGKSLADVARAHGVDPTTVASALQAEASARIDQEVAAGRITADQAAQMKQGLSARIDQRLNAQAQTGPAAQGRRPEGQGEGQHGGPRRPSTPPTQGTAPTSGTQFRGGMSL